MYHLPAVTAPASSFSIPPSIVRPSLSSYAALNFLVSNFLFVIFHLSFSYHSIRTWYSSSVSSLLRLPSLIWSLCLSEPLTRPLVPSSLWNIDRASLPTCLSLSLSLNYLFLKKKKKNKSYLSPFHSPFIIPFHPSIAFYLPFNPSTLFACLPRHFSS